ncbi:MAG: hypothetical protein AAFP19_02605 [Bacteroidota bacterium]
MTNGCLCFETAILGLWHGRGGWLHWRSDGLVAGGAAPLTE